MLVQYSKILHCVTAGIEIKWVHKISDASVLAVCPQYFAILVTKSTLFFLIKNYLYTPNYC